MAYKPTYTWPNPAFPFREYYKGDNCRIFYIENIQHNWEWLSKYHTKFRDTDYFFVCCCWYHDEFFAKEAQAIFEELGLKKSQFYIMFNSPHEMSNFAPYGFEGDVINHNAWLDESLFSNFGDDVEKKYDAICVARLSAFKRHYLAAKVPRLALIAGINHGNPESEALPPYTYRNEKVLSADEVCMKMNESRCGLIMSEKEGACYSSSEYLLTGIPVVSTKSFGGRDVWYNDYNSIVCEPDEDAIAEAVQHFVDNPRDPERIRRDHIALARVYRFKFIAKLGEIFSKHSVDIDPEAYFKDTFMHKFRKSYRPNFDEIFV